MFAGVVFIYVFDTKVIINSFLDNVSEILCTKCELPPAVFSELLSSMDAERLTEGPEGSEERYGSCLLCGLLKLAGKETSECRLC